MLRMKINELFAMLGIVAFVLMLIGFILYLDDVIDSSLYTYGIGLLFIALIGNMLTNGKATRTTTRYDSTDVIGVFITPDHIPHLHFKGGHYLPKGVELIFFPEYFARGEWPRDPSTGKKLDVLDLNQVITDND